MKQGEIGNQAARVALIATLLGLMLSILILASVPPVSRDALTHHLAVPKLYVERGALFEIPWIIFSYYPMNLDLLYTAALYLGNDILPKYIHFGFALLTAGLLFSYLKERINATYGLLGVLLFLSIPVVVKLSITAYVDLGLIFFSTLSLLSLLRWADTGFRWRDLLAAAVSCGLALGTKYNGLIVLFVTTLLVPLLYVRGDTSGARRQVQALGMGAVFVGVAVLVFSPWMIRNYLWTNNPLYPLYDAWFNPESASERQAPPELEQPDNNTSASEAAPQPSPGHFLLRKILYGESGFETLMVPIRVFFQGKDNDPKYFDGVLNPLLLLLPIAVVLGRRSVPRAQWRDERVLLGFSALYLLAVYVQTDMRIRWIAPILPPLVIVSITGLRRLQLWAAAEQKTLRKVFVGAAWIGSLVFLFVSNLAYLIGQFEVVRPFDYLSGQVSREEYITRYRPEYPVIVYANKTLPRDGRILAFYLGNRTYYSDRYLDCRYGFFYEAAKAGRPPEALYELLRKQGFSHLLIRLDLFEEHVGSSVGPEGKDNLRAFFAEHAQLLHEANGYALFALVEKGNPVGAAGASSS